MTERSSPISNKTVLRLSGFVLMVLLLGPPLSYSATAKPQRQPLSTERLLNRIRKAHILAKVPKNAFKSFLLSGCMRIDQKLLPTAAANTKLNCINEETGVLYPSLAYVSVTIGPTRITELIDVGHTKGWQIIDPTTFSVSSPSRTISVLPKMKYDALIENTQHSLPALLSVLQDSEQLNGTQLSVDSDANGIVLKWQTEHSTNEFLFNPKTFLCEQQVRTIGADKSMLKYSNYKRVGNVMLPHTIIAAKGDGTTMATRHIRRWELAMQWPRDHFHPETISMLGDANRSRDK
jgi:hypothetical protein